jgi:hypothetical protein
MSTLTFRNSKIVYYGPYECTRCGEKVCAMGEEWGGNAFGYPDGPIYPNTEWHVHVCDPKLIYGYKAELAKRRILQDGEPSAYSVKSATGDYFIMCSAKQQEANVVHPDVYIVGPGPVRWGTEIDAWLAAEKILFTYTLEECKQRGLPIGESPRSFTGTSSGMTFSS